MHVLVHVRGRVDDLDLWPCAAGHQVDVDGGVLLALDVHDTRELVGVLAELARRGVEIVRVDTVEGHQSDERR